MTISVPNVPFANDLIDEIYMTMILNAFLMVFFVFKWLFDIEIHALQVCKCHHRVKRYQVSNIPTALPVQTARKSFRKKSPKL